MADIESIISGAIAEASGDDIPAAETTATEEAVVEQTTEAVGDTETTEAATEAATETKTEIDELGKELEALGVKPPKEGERENRIPYSRVRKIVENSIKKRVEAHKAELAERDKTLIPLQQAKAEMDRVNALITSDAERYITALATLHPALYRKFLTPQPAPAQTKTPQQVAAENDPKPQPNVRYEDGSVGYNQEGLDKLLEWNTRQAVRTAREQVDAEYGKRFKPIEDQWKAQQINAQIRPKVQAQIAQAKETWGELFPKDGTPEEKELSELWRANPHLDFANVVAKYCAPKALKKAEEAREQVLKDMKARPAAARTAPAAQTKSTPDPNVVRDTEDVIREALAASGLK